MSLSSLLLQVPPAFATLGKGQSCWEWCHGIREVKAIRIYNRWQTHHETFWELTLLLKEVSLGSVLLLPPSLRRKRCMRQLRYPDCDLWGIFLHSSV